MRSCVITPSRTLYLRELHTSANYVPPRTTYLRELYTSANYVPPRRFCRPQRKKDIHIFFRQIKKKSPEIQHLPAGRGRRLLFLRSEARPGGDFFFFEIWGPARRRPLFFEIRVPEKLRLLFFEIGPLTMAATSFCFRLSHWAEVEAPSNCPFSTGFIRFSYMAEHDVIYSEKHNAFCMLLADRTQKRLKSINKRQVL